MKSGVLSGYRVLDLSRILAGPWACQMLADFGADVVKVERPVEGDGSRVYGPPFLKTRDGRELDQSPMYLSANRNKKAIAIDISTAEGQELIRQLAAQSDVLVENYKVGDLARYGLDYDSIKTVNPDIIYCSITGFGQTGPYRERLGYDPIFQAMSGLMGATGQPDGSPGAGPMRSGPSISDLIGGLFADIAILSALLKRERDGGGEYIDLSLLDCSVAVMTNLAMQYLISGEVPVRRGNGGNGGVPAEAYPCLDGNVYISASTDQQYFRLCDVLGRPDLAQEERYRTQRGRMQHRTELVATVGELVSRFRLKDLLEGCAKASVPAAPIHNQKEVFEDPQIRARGMQVEIPHPEAGALKIVANPIRFREHPITQYTAPPAIGEHTRDILSTYLGLDNEAINNLITSGVVAQMPDPKGDMSRK
jgi:crotonobetainyl-CoA:carnitine CoA-transferase CaiB-like acyl-CoA transferase